MVKPTTFDTQFWIAVVIVAVVTAFSVLIMGIFAHDGASPWIRVLGASLLLAGPLFLMLMIVAKTAAGLLHRRQWLRARAGLVLVASIYALGAPAIVLGTWHCVGTWMDAPLFQEASLEGPNAVPMY